LSNRIFETETLTEVSTDEMLSRLREADVIYLGEQHDQVEHHRLQLLVLDSLVESGLNPAIGFEIFPVERTSTLMNYTQRKSSPHQATSAYSAEDWLRGELGWQGEDNVNWQHYGPLLMKAREHKLTAFGADLNRSIRSRVSKHGIEGLTAVERQLIHSTNFSDDHYRKLMYARFKAAHCGWGSDDYLSRLYDNWLARNDTMARALVTTAQAEEGRPVVLITGAGHVQFNMGVYERVGHLAPQLNQVNLAFRALVDEPLPLTAYLRRTEFEGKDYGPDHEYQWFTAAQSSPAEDHCKSFLASKEEHSAGK
jgi:uncharacterized iron-regulated protein